MVQTMCTNDIKYYNYEKAKDKSWIHPTKIERQ